MISVIHPRATMALIYELTRPSGIEPNDIDAGRKAGGVRCRDRKLGEDFFRSRTEGDG